MAQDRITNVAIVGATGRVGSSFAKELVKTGQHKVIALTRQESKGTPPEGVTRVPVDYNDEASLTAALKDQQFLIITLAVGTPKDTSARLVKAAVAAGVQYIMPNTYGSDIESEALATKDPDMFTNSSRALCAGVKELGGTYISMACGFWYELSLACGEPSFGIDIAKKECTFFDDGKTYLTTSTLPQCGRAVAGLLSLPVSEIKNWSNKPIYIDSFRLTQRDMLDSLNRVMSTSDADWKISYEPSRERYERGKKQMQGGDMVGFCRAMYARALFESADGDYGKKLENEKLGLKGEDLDEWTRWTVEKVKGGWNPLREMGYPV